LLSSPYLPARIPRSSKTGLDPCQRRRHWQKPRQECHGRIYCYGAVTLEDGRYCGEYSISNDHVPALPCSGQQGLKRRKGVTHSLLYPWGSSTGIEPCLSPCCRPLDLEGLVWNIFEENSRRYRSVAMGIYKTQRVAEIAHMFPGGAACNMTIRQMEHSMLKNWSHLIGFGLLIPLRSSVARASI